MVAAVNALNEAAAGVDGGTSKAREDAFISIGIGILVLA